MTHIPDAVKQLAEDPSVSATPWAGADVIERAGLAVWLAPLYYPDLAVVQRVRLDDGDVADAVTDLRDVLRSRGRRRAIWSLGPSATPRGLGRTLAGLGMHQDSDPILKALVLAGPPPAGPDDVVVRTATTIAEFELFFDIQQRAFETEEETVERGREHLDEVAEADLSADHVTTYIAYVDGEPVATARATFTDVGVVLNGGSTLHHARSRGAYRALVAARWNEAVARGAPFLTTLARHTSYPILKRLGFVDVGDVEMLVDEF